MPVLLQAVHRNKPYLSAANAEEEIREQELRPESFSPPRKLPPGVELAVRREGSTRVYTVTPSGSKPARHVIYEAP